jgi:DNA-binding response OmpR family regulator
MPHRDRILVIEDEGQIRNLVQEVLETEGFEVVVAPDGRAGLEEARRKHPALILLDQTLPYLDGVEVCRELKQEKATRSTPIIFVTGKREKVDVVVGLGVGADDYVTKPFDVKELVARVRAVRRRARLSQSEKDRSVVCAGPLSLDSERLEVAVDGTKVSLSVVEFRILWALAQSPGVILSRDQILDKINHGDVVVSDRTVDVHINSIRKKLKAFASWVETVRGAGYRVRAA